MRHFKCGCHFSGEDEKLLYLQFAGWLNECLVRYGWLCIHRYGRVPKLLIACGSHSFHFSLLLFCKVPTFSKCLPKLLIIRLDNLFNNPAKWRKACLLAVTWYSKCTRWKPQLHVLALRQTANFKTVIICCLTPCADSCSYLPFGLAIGAKG